MLFDSKSAPASIRTLTTSICPLKHAYVKADVPCKRHREPQTSATTTDAAFNHPPQGIQIYSMKHGAKINTCTQGLAAIRRTKWARKGCCEGARQPWHLLNKLNIKHTFNTTKDLVQGKTYVFILRMQAGAVFHKCCYSVGVSIFSCPH
jgi:hypothetical protein